MNVLDWKLKKSRGEKISMLTCYDASFASILNETEIDALLVGDSVAMVLHGYPTTLQATVEMMALHTASVVRGAPDKFVIADLPFMSYRKGLTAACEAAEVLMRTGAQAVKLEGAQGNLETIQHLVESGIPVQGHLGLTPQSLHQLGGFRVQGKDNQAAEALRLSAKQLEEAGCFSLVLECVPSALAQRVSSERGIPCIGIGAGAEVDGQVLVLQDMLGMKPEFKPRFLRHFADLKSSITEAVSDYVSEVSRGSYPLENEAYK